MLKTAFMSQNFQKCEKTCNTNFLIKTNVTLSLNRAIHKMPLFFQVTTDSEKKSLKGGTAPLIKKIACFVLHLKIINTFLKNDMHK